MSDTTPTHLTVTIRAELDADTVPTDAESRERAEARFQRELTAYVRSAIGEAFTRDPVDGSTHGGYDGICVAGDTDVTVALHPHAAGPAVINDAAARELLALIDERLEVAELNLQQIATMTNPPAHTQILVNKELERWSQAREHILRAQGAATLLTDDEIDAFFRTE